MVGLVNVRQEELEPDAAVHGPLPTHRTVMVVREKSRIIRRRATNDDHHRHGIYVRVRAQGSVVIMINAFEKYQPNNTIRMVWFFFFFLFFEQHDSLRVRTRRRREWDLTKRTEKKKK
jgi:hypothetical protein